MGLQFMVDALKSPECQNPECRKNKERRMVFCRDCYFQLDEDDRNALYAEDPEYFTEAVNNAIEILTA